MSDLSVSENLGLYGKAFAGAVVAALGAYSTALQQGPNEGMVTPAEWITVGLSFLASFAIVWAIPNTPKVLAAYGKLIFAGLAALGASLVTGLTDGTLSQPEVITAVVAFALASGLTGTVSNAAASDPVGADGKLVGISGEAKQALAATQEGTDSTVSVSRIGNRVSVTPTLD